MAKLSEGQIETIPIDSIESHPDNANVGDVGAIVGMIEARDLYGVIQVQRSTGRIIAGNHRWKAAKAAGLTEIRVEWQDIDDHEAIALMVADNRATALATTDEDKLAALLTDLAENATLDGTGFDGDDLDELLADLGMENNRPAGAADPDPEPTAADAAQKKWEVKPGDVWDAGSHVIVCGDATDAGSYALLGVDVFDAMWTDPPYGVDYKGGNTDERREKHRSGHEIAKDSSTEFGELLAGVFPLSVGFLRGGAPWYVSAPAGPNLAVFLNVLGDMLRQCLVWTKTQPVFGRSDYHFQHEMLLYGWKLGAAHQWHGDRKQTSVLYHERLNDRKTNSHPTMKPVSLIVQCLGNSCAAGDAVLDPFLGSGSTILACEHLGLRGYGIEIEPKFVAVALQRLADVGLEPKRRV